MSQTVDIRELNERIESKSSFVNMITMGMDKVIVGQKHLVESLIDRSAFGRPYPVGRCAGIGKDTWPLRHWHH